jgi:anthranilate 1,2-dioxygenase small subunit
VIMNTELRELHWVVERLNYDYAEVLDSGAIEQWPAFFTEDAVYRVTSKENADGGFPAGLIYCQGMGMLKDRAFALANTETFMPRYTQHHVNNVRVLSVEKDLVRAEANYMVLETLTDEPTRILQAGKYIDRIVRDGDRLLFKERQCVYHTLVIPNALVFPV